MDVVVWTLPDCPRCEKAKAALRAGGLSVTERELRRLRSGEEPDVDAMAQLLLTDETTPLVRANGRFWEPEEIDVLGLLREGETMNVIAAPKTGKSWLVLIHHTTKGLQSGKGVTDVSAGAGSQSRAADCHFILRPHEVDDCLSVDAVARSWPPPEAFVIRKSFPLWTSDPALDPRDLKKPYQKPRKRDEDDDGDEPEKPVWTPEKFAARFIGAEPKTKAALFAAANEEDLTDYQAGKLLRKAETTGLIHRPRRRARGCGCPNSRKAGGDDGADGQAHARRTSTARTGETWHRLPGLRRQAFPCALHPPCRRQEDSPPPGMPELRTAHYDP